MKTNRNLLRNLVLVVASAFIFAGVASAQEYRGAFTLPFAAKWGGATLPAGDYTFDVDSHNGASIVRIERGTRNVGVVMAQSKDQSYRSDGSELIVTRGGGRARIRALHLADAGMDLRFSAPKAEALELASNPVLIQRIPLSRSGK